MKAVTSPTSFAPRCVSRAGGSRDRTGEGEFEQALGAASSGAPALRPAPHEPAAPREADSGQGRAEENTEAQVEWGAGRDDPHTPGMPSPREVPVQALVLDSRNAAAVAEPGAQNVPALPPAAVPEAAVSGWLAVAETTEQVPASPRSSASAAPAPSQPSPAEAEGLRVRVLASRVATPAPLAREAQPAPRAPAAVGASPAASPAALPDAPSPNVSATHDATLDAVAGSARAIAVTPLCAPADGAPVAEIATTSCAPVVETATDPGAAAQALAIEEPTLEPSAGASEGLPPGAESPGHRASIDLEEKVDGPVAGAAPKPIARQPHAAPVQGRTASKPSLAGARLAAAVPQRAQRPERERSEPATARQHDGVPANGLAAPEPGAATETPALTAAWGRAPERSAPGAPREASAPQTAATIEDARFQPLRRAADQVTLQFRGEGGLEGRLRISVRGDAVQATVLSSHEGTLERLGSETGSLRRALNEQGFSNARIAVHDLRDGGAPGSADARHGARDHDERRQGEPQRRSGQGRDTRQHADSDEERRSTRDERRSS